MTVKHRLQALNRARREYLHHPSRALLRAYLIQKARKAVEAGHPIGGWDPRMCKYYGVDSNVTSGCKSDIVRAYAQGLVPFSTTGGSHAPGSFHKARDSKGRGMAVDNALVEAEVGTAKGRRRMVRHQADIHRRHRAGTLGHDLAELIGPDNKLIVLRDRETDLVEGTPLETMHDTHVHSAYRT